MRLLGDPHQLAAVEAGGVLRLIARAGGAVELDQLHRFRTAGEADASLALRDGEDNRTAFDWYRGKGRIVAGNYEAMCDAVFEAWAKDLRKGRTSLMTAADTATVTALNLRAQAWHIEAGTIDTRHTTAARRAERAHRRHHRHPPQPPPHDRARRPRLRQERRHLDHHRDPARRRRRGPPHQHRGRIRLPAPYVAAQCELGYASTIHRAQGMTVDTSHALASARSQREGVYVQLTRGARTNRLYLAIEDGDRLDDVLASIAARRRTQLSATETIAALQHDISAPASCPPSSPTSPNARPQPALTGQLEDALGADRAAWFLAADAYRPDPRAARRRTRPASTFPDSWHAPFPGAVSPTPTTPPRC